MHTTQNQTHIHAHTHTHTHTHTHPHPPTPTPTHTHIHTHTHTHTHTHKHTHPLACAGLSCGLEFTHTHTHAKKSKKKNKTAHHAIGLRHQGLPSTRHIHSPSPNIRDASNKDGLTLSRCTETNTSLGNNVLCCRNKIKPPHHSEIRVQLSPELRIYI